MADPLSTPRVDSTSLESFTNKTIRLVGKVSLLRGELATLDSSGAVTAHLNRDAHLTVGNYVEIVGKVNADLSVRVLRATDLGRDVDFDAVKAVVDATHRYKEIFYTADE